MWYKIFADGSEIDIVYANSPIEAIGIAKSHYGDAVYTWRHY